jgi:hypothetical protein
MERKKKAGLMNWHQIELTIERAGHLLTANEARRMLFDERLCTAVTKDGAPCRNRAMWESQQQLCQRHSPKIETKGQPRSKRPRCNCRAYAFPHRPTTGHCRWPEPPLIVSDKPAGTRQKKQVFAKDETGRAGKMPENATNLGNGSGLDALRFIRGKQIRAVAELVDGQLTTQQIADLVRIHKRTLLRWKKRPDFRAYWHEHRAKVYAGLRAG